MRTAVLQATMKTPETPEARERRTSPARGSAVVGRFATVLFVGALVSCRSYPERTAGALADFQRGRFAEALASYEDEETTGSEFLRGAEAGMVGLVAGDWDAALRNLTRAAKEVEQIEREALISPESLGETLIQWTINEKFTTYRGEGYERVLLHAELALTYIALGSLEDARVEVRQANALLETEEELYETKYAAGGLGHFLSAISYEIEGALDEAYIDYRRMVEKGVGTELAGKALVRLAKSMGRDDEVQRWRERFGDVALPDPDAASVILIAGVGLGPYKREVSITVPLPEGAVRWAVPEYVDRAQAVDSVGLSVDSAQLGVRSVVIEDVSDVARKNLEHRIAWLGTRSAVRAWLKYKLQSNAYDSSADDSGWGGLLYLAGLAFVFATEQADLRGWQTLPDSWQAARMFLPPGRHGLVLEARGGERVELGEYELEPGETMFVFVRTLGTRVIAHAVGGLPVGLETLGESPAPAPPVPELPAP